jgi:NADH-quinone oxidoreductase subunit A
VIAEGPVIGSYLEPYVPAGVYLTLIIATGIGMMNASRLLGPRRPGGMKATTYECGVPLLGSPREQFPVKFYLVAILFVLFDIETVFLIPWAVVFRRFGAAGVIEMLVFLFILAFGLLYVWRRRGLEWE